MLPIIRNEDPAEQTRLYNWFKY
jgi:hypothetical protein